MTEIKSQLNPAEAAFSRLQQFPSDYVDIAAHIASTKRMNEMEAWAEGIGAHTERLANSHRLVGRQIIETADKTTGVVDLVAAQDRINRVPKDWRTGVKVAPNGDIQVNKHFPFYGDTPAHGWKTYRAPKNIKPTI